MKIVMIASEAVPFAKTGGLADVVGALPKVLKSLGHQVIVILPKYATIDYVRYGLRPFLSPLGVWMGEGQEWASVHTTKLDGVPYYFIESNKYFDRWGLYHDASFNDYLDNPRRFGFLSRAALQLCRDISFNADIIHAHDWQTALAPAYQKIWHWDDPILGETASVLTIHNIAHQGSYDAKDYNYLGLQWANFNSDKFEDHGRINFVKGGIWYADVVNTVSPSYARESRTPLGGFGLAMYLNNKGDRYSGILNGVDYNEWDPAKDSLIPAPYTASDLAGKAVCKAALQQRMQLESSPDTPIIGVISRLVAQKGLDLLASTIEDILSSMRVQFAILGSGDKFLEDFFGNLPKRYPGRVGSYIGYSNELAHWIEAGSDFFIMPSIYEPCGLNQMYSLKYGTPPIVRATGGLDDTVLQYDEVSGTGTGFKFWTANSSAIYYTTGWAVSTYYDRKEHLSNLIQAGMAQDFSWERSGRQYLELYQRAMAIKRSY